MYLYILYETVLLVSVYVCCKRSYVEVKVIVALIAVSGSGVVTLWYRYKGEKGWGEEICKNGEREEHDRDQKSSNLGLFLFVSYNNNRCFLIYY